MPVALSYPGVYVEELPSAVRTISGVATSIAAFVGCAQRGPTDASVLVSNYSDFTRLYGGLWANSPLSYAVQQFFLNGGTQAVIARVVNIPLTVNPGDPPAAAAATAVLVNSSAGGTTGTGASETGDANKSSRASKAGGAKDISRSDDPAATTVGLIAANAGAWGSSLRAWVDLNTVPPDPKKPNVLDPALFNLYLLDTSTGASETFRNVSVLPGNSRFVTQVLAQQSQFARINGALPQTAPPAIPASNPVQFGSGHDGPSVTGTQVTGGFSLLDQADTINLLCIPPFDFNTDVDQLTWDAATAYAATRRAMVLVDPPSTWTSATAAADGLTAANNGTGTPPYLVPTRVDNAALYFPRVLLADPLKENSISSFAPCGVIAGVYARTDANRGIWKAAAGIDATLQGVSGLSLGGQPGVLTDADSGQLNPLGINCLRSLVGVGNVVWGARTLYGTDVLASQWKYVPVRRLALYIEESLFRGTQWVVFEPNDEALWSQIRLNVGSFMQTLFQQGAFQGTSPSQAYFVKCSSETTTQTDIDNGIVNIVVGFAPVKPAEFVVLQIQQISPQS